MIIVTLVPLENLLDFLLIRIFKITIICIFKVFQCGLSLNAFVFTNLYWLGRRIEPHHELSFELFLLKQELILPYLFINFSFQVIFTIRVFSIISF